MIITHNKKFLFLFPSVLILIYLLLLIKTAWLGDDAYITFRTIDNFVNGYGLRWNVAERVQSYTHPLWLFLLSLIYFFTKEIFFTSLITSILISVFAVVLLSFKLSHSLENVFIVLLAIIFSKAFLDYSTSGLENPLTHLLLAIFALVYFKFNKTKNQKFILGILSSLLLLNRMDLILIIIPVLVSEIMKTKGGKENIYILYGLFPFIFWEIFSLIYYGFPFPNTAYAKLNTGIERWALIIEGLKYIKVSFLLDPITILLILLSIFLTTVDRNKTLLPLCIGIILHVFYLTWIGGDFMAGRFLTAPFFIALIILGKVDFENFTKAFITILLIILVGSISLFNTLYSRNFNSNSKTITDERLLYYNSANLLAAIKGKEMPVHNWAILGKFGKQSNQRYATVYSIGFFGYYVGSQCFVIDKLALGDPLLSKLPAEIPWRIGHFKRKIPDGYIETLESSKIHIKDPDLSNYYQKLTILTREEIFSLTRIKEIFKFNLGEYDYLIDNYISRSNN